MADSYGSYSWTDVASQVTERDVRFVSRGSTPLLRDDEFTRAWKIDAHLAERVRVFLDLYGDGEHFVEGDDTLECHAIENPAASQGVTMPGWWRVVRNFEMPEMPGMVLQTLRRGFLRPPSISNTAWEHDEGADREARIWRVQESHSDVKTAFATHYVVIYPHVDKTYVREFCEELIARGSISSPTFDQQTQLEGSYQFRVVRNEEQEDGTSTVFATLVSEIEPHGLEVLIYDGCATKEWVTFFFQLSILPEVPQSTSGISYRLQNINYDRELGLWNCTLHKTERKTIGVPLHTTGKDLFEEQQAVNWQGVREGDIDHLGTPIPLEPVGLADDGAIVDISRSKNDDCTQNIGQRRTKELPIEKAEERESRTIFQHDKGQTDRAQEPSAVQPVPDASGGVVVQQTVSKTRANKRNISRNVSTEKPVSEASTGGTKTIYEHRERQTDRNQATADATIPEAGGGVVTTKGNEKTPGGLFNVTVETTTEKAVSGASKSAQATIFETVERESDRNVADGAVTIEGASGGVIKSTQAERTPGGLFNKTTATTTEKSVDNAQQSKTVTVFEEHDRKTHRNRASPELDVPTPSDGKVVTKQNDKTPGGLFNVTIDERQEKSVTGAQKTRSKTIFEERSRDVDRGVASDNPDVPAATGGLVTSKTVEKTPGGWHVVSTDETQELPVTRARRTVRKRAYSTLETVVDRSVEGPPADPTGVGTTITADQTPGKLYNVSTEKPLELNSNITTYFIPDGNDNQAKVIDYHYLTQTEFVTLIAGLDQDRKWSVGHNFDEAIGRWSGRAIGKDSFIGGEGFSRGDIYKAGLTETKFSIKYEANGTVVLVRTKITYNKRAANKIHYLNNKYMAEPARLDGSQIQWDARNNRGTYIAVVSRKIKRFDITTAYTAGAEIDFASYAIM